MTVIDRNEAEQKLEAVGRALLHVQGRRIDRAGALAAGAKIAPDLYATYAASLGGRQPSGSVGNDHLIQAKSATMRKLEAKAVEIQCRDDGCDPAAALIRAAQTHSDIWNEFRAAMPRA